MILILRIRKYVFMKMRFDVFWVMMLMPSSLKIYIPQYMWVCIENDLITFFFSYFLCCFFLCAFKNWPYDVYNLNILESSPYLNYSSQYIYSKKSIVLALTSSHSFSSLGVESNPSNVTCFNLFRSHQTRLLVRRQEVRENSHI